MEGAFRVVGGSVDAGNGAGAGPVGVFDIVGAVFVFVGDGFAGLAMLLENRGC